MTAMEQNNTKNEWYCTPAKDLGSIFCAIRSCIEDTRRDLKKVRADIIAEYKEGNVLRSNPNPLRISELKAKEEDLKTQLKTHLEASHRILDFYLGVLE